MYEETLPVYRDPQGDLQTRVQTRPDCGVAG